MQRNSFAEQSLVVFNYFEYLRVRIDILLAKTDSLHNENITSKCKAWVVQQNLKIVSTEALKYRVIAKYLYLASNVHHMRPWKNGLQNSKAVNFSSKDEDRLKSQFLCLPL